MILNQTDFFARSATLNGAISDTDTEITLTGLSTRFTDAVAAETVRYPLGPFRISDDDGFELIAITGHVSGSTFDVERGIQGTSAEAWGDGTAVRAVVASQSNIIYTPWVSGQVGRAVPTESTKYIADDFVHDPTQQDDLLSTRTAPTGQQWFHDENIAASGTTYTGPLDFRLDNNRARATGSSNVRSNALVSLGSDLYAGPSGTEEAYVVNIRADASYFAFDEDSSPRSSPGIMLCYIDSDNFLTAFKAFSGGGANWEVKIAAMINGSAVELASVERIVTGERESVAAFFRMSASFGVSKAEESFECSLNLSNPNMNVAFRSPDEWFDDKAWTIDDLFPTSTTVGIIGRFNRVFFHNFAARFDTL